MCRVFGYVGVCMGAVEKSRGHKSGGVILNLVDTLLNHF